MDIPDTAVRILSVVQRAVSEELIDGNEIYCRLPEPLLRKLARRSEDAATIALLEDVLKDMGAAKER